MSVPEICSHCLYPSHHPFGIEFDVDGVCSGCKVFLEKNEINWDEKHQDLKNILKEYKSSRSNYDCIVPLCGGKDDIFVLHLVCNVYKLRPLLVVYNSGYMSKIGNRFLEYLRDTFGCDIDTFTLNPKSRKNLIRASLEHLGSLHWQAIAGYTVYPVQVAARKRIPLIIWGAHQGLEQVGMYSHYHNVEMSRRYRREHDLLGFEAEDMCARGFVNDCDAHNLFYPADECIQSIGVRGIYLGNYHRWDTFSQHMDCKLKYNLVGMRNERTFDSLSYHHDALYLMWHDIIKKIKFGYGKLLDDCCREIRHGRIRRDQAIRLVNFYNQKDIDTSVEVLNLFDISKNDVLNYAKKHSSKNANRFFNYFSSVGSTAQDYEDVEKIFCEDAIDFDPKNFSSIQLLTKGGCS